MESSNTHHEHTDDCELLEVTTTMRPMDRSNPKLLEAKEGSTPVILVTADLSRTNPNFDVDVAGFDSARELAGILTALASAINSSTPGDDEYVLSEPPC